MAIDAGHLARPNQMARGGSDEGKAMVPSSAMTRRPSSTNKSEAWAFIQNIGAVGKKRFCEATWMMRRGKDTMFTFDESFWSHDGYEDDGTGYLRKLGCALRTAARHSTPNRQDQKYVFNTFGKRVLDNAWNGYHCCLFAYGQTGSGKSYSMVGYGNNKGIVPISCEEIFRRIANDDSGNSYEVLVSAIEIYNEAVQDLLIPVEQRPRKGFEIRESKILGVYIDGITKRPVESYKAIHDTIEEATTHRTVGSTLMNATSSRAHTVLIIEFKTVTSCSTRVSMINLVDLAGSEKVKQTGAEGERMKEGAMINKSLRLGLVSGLVAGACWSSFLLKRGGESARLKPRSTLGNCIEKLAEKSTNPKKAPLNSAGTGLRPPAVLVPYRESKLTRLLQNALGGSSKTIMICALSPASSNYEETLSTLRYADRAKKIKNKAVVNENPQEKLMRELLDENQKLKEMIQSLGAGRVDARTFEDLGRKQREIAEAEAALKDMQKTFQEKLEEDRQRQGELRSTVVNPMVPMIVNLNQDPQLQGRVKHYFPAGKTLIGCNKQDESESESEASGTGPEQAFSESDDLPVPDINMLGRGMQRLHASVENASDGRCILRALNGEAAQAAELRSCGVAGVVWSGGAEVVVGLKTWWRGEWTYVDWHALATCLNGMTLDRMLEMDRAEAEFGRSRVRQKCGRAKDRPNSRLWRDAKKCPRTRVDDGFVLVHADRLIFGPCYFVFVQPNICSAEVLIASGEADFTTAQMEEMREKRRTTDARPGLFRSATEKRIRQSLYSPCMVLPGALGLEDAQHFEQMQEMQKAGSEDDWKELEQVKRTLQLKDNDHTSDLRLTSADIARMVTRLRRPAQEQVLRAKEDEVEELRRELALLRNPGVELPGKQRRERLDEMLYAGHSKVSLAIDNTFEEALAQLSAVEAMLTSCAPRGDSPKSLGTRRGDTTRGGWGSVEIWGCLVLTRADSFFLLRFSLAD
ncbi:Kinesin-related protein 1 (Kinesin family member 1) (Kinesin-3) [Durusdinium trenchii]|uniref:Kinesin-like protein n=1 Tax=Durusdinium trenchii TaxID=1381693 RepID=A0ABP0SQZ7_9DINO